MAAKKFGFAKRSTSPFGAQRSKQIAHAMLPSRDAMAEFTGGKPGARSLNQYAKEAPADLSGVKGMKLNLLTKG